jgi:hypothetical protein
MELIESGTAHRQVSLMNRIKGTAEDREAQ